MYTWEMVFNVQFRVKNEFLEGGMVQLGGVIKESDGWLRMNEETD